MAAASPMVVFGLAVRAASAARERPATRVPRRRGDATSPPGRPWLPLDGLSPLCTATARRGRNQHLAPLNYRVFCPRVPFLARLTHSRRSGVGPPRRFRAVMDTWCVAEYMRGPEGSRRALGA